MSISQACGYSSDEMRLQSDEYSEGSGFNERKRKIRKLGYRTKSKLNSNILIPNRKSARKKIKTEESTCRTTNHKSKNKKNDDNDKELVSDDMCSTFSDVKPPSLFTRLRQRKLDRRKNSYSTGSNTSSALESDSRYAKSEPILITLDSDSEDEVLPILSSRPNRTARVQGEILRKFGKLSHSHVEDARYSETSSSEEENSKKKKRKKKKSVKHTSDGKKYVSSCFTDKQNLNVKRHNRNYDYVYSPIKQTHRIKIRNLRKRFESKNRLEHLTSLSIHSELLIKRSSSRLTVNSNRKKNSTRRNATVVGVYYNPKEAFKSERKRRKLSKISYKKESENEKSKRRESVSYNENDIKKITTPRRSLSIDIKIATSKDVTSKNNNLKTNLDNKNIKPDPEPKESDIKPEEDTELKLNDQHDLRNRGEDTECDSDKHLENKNEQKIHNNESDMENIKNQESDTLTEPMKKSSDDEKKTRNGNFHLKSKIHRGSSYKKKSINKTPIPGIIRKRGRPRLSESIPKSAKVSPFSENKSQIAFLQNTVCYIVAPKLSKCRECRLTNKNKKMQHVYCRFMEYRKLCFNKNGVIFNAGFSNPSDATDEHKNSWLPQPDNPPTDLDFQTSKKLLRLIGDQFCDLMVQEREAIDLHIGLQQVMTWKRIVQGVREMCDVCSTTIFNVHWVCPICGFSVCIDCYKVRKQGVVTEDDEEQPKDRDEFKWLLCTMRQPHEQDSLILTQIIPGDVLVIMNDLVHKVRDKLKIISYCRCSSQKVSSPDNIISTGLNKQLLSFVSKKFSSERNYNICTDKHVLKNTIDYEELDYEISDCSFRWLVLSDYSNDEMNNSSDGNSCTFEEFDLPSNSVKWNVPDSKELVDIFTNRFVDKKNDEIPVLNHFHKRYPQVESGRDPLPIRVYTKMESLIVFHDVSHSWFCNGRLLFLHSVDHTNNLLLFQEQWKRGQPILVQNVQEKLDMTLWHPDGFSRDFGDVKNDLVDCKTGSILKNLPMRKFWEGFENFSKRLTDENGEYMLLKLKDWPPGEDFSEKLPTRYQDLMKGLPLPEYTHRDGIFNLAGRLPTYFVRPDLGPKMYNAYGSALYPTKGTTNLHLDVSDAVNVMVYVGIPSDGNAELHIQEALKAIDEGGCDSLMRQRVRSINTKPGALWHIYNARDADKIRDLLTKVAIERGEKLEAHHDPIHDQSWYMDTELRTRLYREYGVEGYAIAQCLGDAVFIPAGAPHQVRNLHSCVKVAEDFVSPENIAHCFKLTQEFRHLSDTHTNHEDKLQIKNIIYHVIRDALSHLQPVLEVGNELLML